MANIDSSGRVAYMYNADDDTWYAISGAVNTNAAYTWTATQTFGATVNVESALNAQAGINNFLDEIVRDDLIPSPVNGTVCFIRSLNQLQYYWNGAWRWFNDSTELSSIVADYTLQLSDAGKTLNVNSSADITITVPPNSAVPFVIGQRLDLMRTGSGNVTFAQGAGVVIQSKNSNKKIAARYSAGTLIKLDTNTWILIGDLTA